jgi:hypothetical protein
MKTVQVSCAFLALLAVASADTPTKNAAKKAKPKAEPVFVTATDIKFGPAPPQLPKGAEVGVLYGDPTKAGAFTIRIKMPDGYKIPPHWHSQDEQLTVLGGTLNMYMGDEMTSPHALDAGSYHYLPGKMHHAAVAKGDVVLQLHGVGPFDIHYVNPADNPTPKSATR